MFTSYFYTESNSPFGAIANYSYTAKISVQQLMLRLKKFSSKYYIAMHYLCNCVQLCFFILLDLEIIIRSGIKIIINNIFQTTVLSRLSGHLCPTCSCCGTGEVNIVIIYERTHLKCTRSAGQRSINPFAGNVAILHHA